MKNVRVVLVLLGTNHDENNTILGACHVNFLAAVDAIIFIVIVLPFRASDAENRFGCRTCTATRFFRYVIANFSDP